MFILIASAVALVFIWSLAAIIYNIINFHDDRLLTNTQRYNILKGLAFIFLMCTIVIMTIALFEIGVL